MSQISPATPIQEVELKYFLRDGQPTWGRDLTKSVLSYAIEYYDIPDSMKVREYEYFTGFKPNVSYAGFHMKLKRKSTPFIFNFYIPSALFVMVSWTSFVIPVHAIPGRIALIITTFLVLINIANSAFSNSPTAPGINLIQVRDFFTNHRMKD